MGVPGVRLAEMSVLTTLVVLGAVVLGPELEHCRLGKPVFKSETIGFVPDMCGQVFVTKDGGVTWAPTRSGLSRDLLSMRSLEVGGSFADGSVMFGGYLGSKLLRTVDDGVTWTEVSIPSSAWLYAMVVRDAQAWGCGSDGPLIHSADSGRTWVAVKVPTNSDERCISLDFLDGRRGWVAGWYGSLWATEDGGETWRKVALPPAFTPSAPNQRTLSRVVRVSATLGFVQGNQGTYRTRDGGATWEHLVLPENASLVMTRVGAHRLLVTKDSAAKPIDQQRVDLSGAFVPRGESAVGVSNEQVISWSVDGTRRVLGVCGRASGEHPRIETVRVLGALRSAFNTRRAFLSFDEGSTWRELSPLPGEVVFDQFVMVDRERALAKSGGKYFRSDDAGRNWRETASSLDVMDLTRALGGSPEDPLSCLASGKSGKAKLTFGVQGCFGGNSNELTLTWGATGGELAVRYDGLRERAPAKKHLTANETHALLDELHARATRAEEASQCTSTNVFKVTLEVSCTLAAKAERQTVTLDSDDCGTSAVEPGVGGSTSSGTPSGYARAVSLHDWALGL